eukprot:gb/GECH01004181.1/.p1 GENE.gb/GECH01004181.1/~~gb/GECH01004181.1/.p1  ORF type:complete len:152 (+),score=48.53 gb/GECH01004181.1/:1-456(+)
MRNSKFLFNLLFKGVYRVFKNILLSILVLGGGLSFQYLRLTSNNQHNRQLLEQRLNAVEDKITGDHEHRINQLYKKIDNRTQELQNYQEQRFNQIEEQINEMDQRHESKLNELKENGQKILSTVRINENRISHIISGLNEESTAEQNPSAL